MGDSEEILYPEIEPLVTGHLQVSPVHSIYYEDSGNKNGLPVVFVHGGPGSGTSKQDRRYFDPVKYRIILFDQRGAGLSTPPFCLEENTTWDLVADMEKLREHLGIDRWVVFGGSWGSTLCLVYAESHPARVLALILRGIFTFRPSELKWIFQEGASVIYPDLWEEFVAPIPEPERDDFIRAYYKRLIGTNEEEKLAAAMAWTKWEMATAQLHINPDNLKRTRNGEFSIAFALIEAHYFINGGFFKSPTHVLDNVGIIRDANIPVTIIQGRYDMCCPVKTAYELYKALPKAEFYIVQDAGHSSKEIGITQKLVEACDKYAKLNK